jgi:hypothetical protein
MIDNYSARLSGSKRALIALLASSAVFAVGCVNLSTTIPMSANPLSSPADLSGKIHGGNQPVVGATVTLWYAGQSGPAILAATTTTDSGGFFSFSKDTVNGNTDSGNQYSCPLNSDPLVYVVSKGGNTQNNGIATQSNSAAAFIAIYGDCKELSASNFVYMSEVTTAATMAAAVQFFDPNTDTLVADGTGQQKIVVDEIPATIALLANSATGLAVTSTNLSPIPGANVASGVTVTAVPESGKLNVIANIISACINGATSGNAACNTLFASAVPPQPNTTNLNGSYPSSTTDTLQALYYMFTNPTNGQGSTGATNLAALFSLAGGVGAPYQPAASQPTDWTLAVAYVGSGTCGTPTGGTGDFINAPVDINIDGHDNVWIANSETGGNLSAISQAGAPVACVNLDPGSSNDGAVIDSSANVWYAAGTTMYRYNPNTRATLAFPVGVSPLAVTADGVGNVYFSSASGSVGSLYQIPGAATAVAAVAPVQISNQVGPNPIRMMPSFKGTATLGDIWLSTGSTSVAQVTAGTGPGSMGGFVTNLIPAVSESSYGLVVARNSVFVADGINGDINWLVFNGTDWVSASGWPFTNSASAGISGPTGITIDGRANTWIPDSGSPSLSEISLFGPIALSPSTGYVKSTSDLNASLATAVDQAGNVWVAGSGNHFITEFVGAGVPIYQPFAVGIANGRFQQIP